MLNLHFRKGRIIIPLILIIFTGILLSGNRIRKNIHSLPNKSWKAGSAAMVITPEKDLWMEGFAARDKPAHGKLQDLWVKALALEDSMGNRALVITTDIIGYPREISQPVCDRLEKALSLKRSQILLSASHTHSAPVINQNLSGIYPPFEEEMKKNIAEYREIFEDRVVKCAEKAFSDLHPVVISRGTGIARFAVNRRNNKESDFPYTQDPAGPSDYSVAVRSPINKLYFRFR